MIATGNILHGKNCGSILICKQNCSTYFWGIIQSVESLKFLRSFVLCNTIYIKQRFWASTNCVCYLNISRDKRSYFLKIEFENINYTLNWKDIQKPFLKTWKVFFRQSPWSKGSINQDQHKLRAVSPFSSATNNILKIKHMTNDPITALVPNYVKHRHRCHPIYVSILCCVNLS